MRQVESRPHLWSTTARPFVDEMAVSVDLGADQDVIILALAEQLGGAAASLVITRQKSPGATFALASIEQNPR